MTRRSGPRAGSSRRTGSAMAIFVLAQGVPPNPRGSEAVETRTTAPRRIKCLPILRRKNFPVDNALLPGVNECAYLGDTGPLRVGRSGYFLIRLRVFREVGTCGKDRGE